MGDEGVAGGGTHPEKVVMGLGWLLSKRRAQAGWRGFHVQPCGELSAAELESVCAGKSYLFNNDCSALQVCLVQVLDCPFCILHKV